MTSRTTSPPGLGAPIHMSPSFPITANDGGNSFWRRPHGDVPSGTASSGSLDSPYSYADRGTSRSIFPARASDVEPPHALKVYEQGTLNSSYIPAAAAAAGSTSSSYPGQYRNPYAPYDHQSTSKGGFTWQQHQQQRTSTPYPSLQGPPSLLRTPLATPTEPQPHQYVGYSQAAPSQAHSAYRFPQEFASQPPPPQQQQTAYMQQPATVMAKHTQQFYGRSAPSAEWQGPADPDLAFRASRRDSAGYIHSQDGRSPVKGGGAAAKSMPRGKEKDSRRFVCNVDNCNKTFNTSGHLARHIKTHSGEKPFSCPIGDCMSRFSRHDNMLQHYRAHTRKLRLAAETIDGANGQRGLASPELTPSSAGEHNGAPSKRSSTSDGVPNANANSGAAMPALVTPASSTDSVNTDPAASSFIPPTGYASASNALTNAVSALVNTSNPPRAAGMPRRMSTPVLMSYGNYADEYARQTGGGWMNNAPAASAAAYASDPRTAQTEMRNPGGAVYWGGAVYRGDGGPFPGQEPTGRRGAEPSRGRSMSFSTVSANVLQPNREQTVAADGQEMWAYPMNVGTTGSTSRIVPQSTDTWPNTATPMQSDPHNPAHFAPPYEYRTYRGDPAPDPAAMDALARRRASIHVMGTQPAAASPVYPMRSPMAGNSTPGVVGERAVAPTLTAGFSAYSIGGEARGVEEGQFR
ncbi:uncharacterized protein EV422DRAFT_568143 [Fimicolochytrium jonesii]|uniref:uncharacterized protein n=1 Tax=Fimicolochytrium jonesii TaxID=1396493 RepID=UPI0022FF263E|nr:uncharacterized protein EV422DRAFT_568143 [Fimicolochytrium jonesii]KAI8820190.1 hypothetical protein EV422DRAFT_568143 [Fimicolochytrium jonesii]